MQPDALIKHIIDSPVYCDNRKMLPAELKNLIDTATKEMLNLKVDSVELLKKQTFITEDICQEVLLFNSRTWGTIKAIFTKASKHLEKASTILLCQGKNYPFQIFNDKTENGKDDLAVILSRNGFHTIRVDYGIGSNAGTERDYWDIMGLTLGLIGVSPLKIILEKHLSVLEWVKAQKWYQGKGAGILGRSLGGYIAAYLGLVSEDIISVALTNCLANYKELVFNRFNLNAITYPFGVLQYYDFQHLVCAILPKPLHLQYSSNDPYFAKTGSENFTGVIMEYNRNYKLEALVDIFVSDTYHATNPAPIIPFFKNTLT